MSLESMEEVLTENINLGVEWHMNDKLTEEMTNDRADKNAKD